MLLSPKQKLSLTESTARINIWEGSVRSGKTFASILKFCHALIEGPPGNAMIIGVSRESIQRNIIGEMCNLLQMHPPTPKTQSIEIFGRQLYFVGANDERAQRRIQGSTLAIAYVDEATNIPSGFWRMLLSRLSVPEAQLFATTNPDSPFHWLKTEYIDKEGLDLQKWSFRLEDNPSLDENYVESLKKEFSGLWYQRYINGEWVLADGVVYDMFDQELHVLNTLPGNAKYNIVGIDYGTTNPTVFQMVSINTDLHPNYWLEKEYYFDSAKAVQKKTDSDLAEDLKRFISSHNVQAIYVDPSAASFKIECQRQGITQMKDADNDVINGIRFVSQLISNGSFKVSRGAGNTIREFGSYTWDTKVSERGEDKPVKKHDHCLDALRYCLFTHLGLGGRLVTPEEINSIYARARGIDNTFPEFYNQTQSNRYGSFY